jgi:hypothetical protein
MFPLAILGLYFFSVRRAIYLVSLVALSSWLGVGFRLSWW